MQMCALTLFTQINCTTVPSVNTQTSVFRSMKEKHDVFSSLSNIFFSHVSLNVGRLLYIFLIFLVTFVTIFLRLTLLQRRLW